MKNKPKNRYFILITILIIMILLTSLINNVIRNYKYIKADKSLLENYISKVNIDELDIALSELNEIILYVSYNHDKNIIKLDRDILKKIKMYNLENYVYYCNVTDRLENYKYIGDFIVMNSSINGKLKKAPALIYFKNGEVIEIINSTNELITSEDLMYLIDKYEIGK